MSLSKKISLAICIATIVLFVWGIPLGLYERSTAILSIVGGVILFIGLFQYFGEFTSLDEIIEKQDPNVPQPAGRKLAPFMVLPAFVFMIILVIYVGHKKQSVLNHNGKLAKGTVVTGESKTSTRRLQTTTSYNIRVQFVDSLGVHYYFDESISGGDFNNMYEGAEVDVVYWREDPRVAKVVFTLEDLGKYKTIATEPITISHLTDIIEGKVNEDSIKDYLNTINYEWTDLSEGGFENSKLKLALKYVKTESTIVFVQANHTMGYAINEDGSIKFSFDQDLLQKGYKKQASADDDGKQIELFYTDDYVIQKTIKLEAVDGRGLESYVIYSVTKLPK